ncbi:MAG: hypothetical protein JXN61_05915 [Sedimentisphaerales bacterium]|nr:hypothetical protein [Sedimentisphaerales bacterium]
MGGKEGHSEALARMLDSLGRVTGEVNAQLMPVYTNVKSLNDGLEFWIYQFHGAALAAVAHSLAPIIRSISIAATYDLKNLKPWGSHPLIDPNYSSSDLTVQHVGIRLSRLAKTRLVADWETGLQNIRVCTQINSVLKASSNALNCGKCEKCIRTMTALVALGKLGACRVFPVNDVSKELLKSVVIESDYQQACYEELIEPLALKGRDDLVHAIKKLILTYRMKRSLKRLDQRLSGGKLLALKKTGFKRPDGLRPSRRRGSGDRRLTERHN